MIASVGIADRKNERENFKLNTVSLSFKIPSRFMPDHKGKWLINRKNDLNKTTHKEKRLLLKTA